METKLPNHNLLILPGTPLLSTSLLLVCSRSVLQISLSAIIFCPCLCFVAFSSGLWINECYLDERSDTIQGIERINKQRFGLNCKICGSKAHGACIQCIEPKCVYGAHPSCALERGLQMTMETDYTSNSMRYYMYCDRHRTLLGASIPRIIRAAGDPIAPPLAGSVAPPANLAVVIDSTTASAADIAPTKSVVHVAPAYDPFLDETKDCCICSFGMLPQPVIDPDAFTIMQCAKCKLKAHVGCYGALNRSKRTYSNY